MATGTYKVILTGQFEGSRTRSQIRKELMALFKFGDAEVDRLLDSAPVTIKSDLDFDTASKYKAAIEQTGALCDVREMRDEQEAPLAAPPPPPPPPPSSGRDAPSSAPLQPVPAAQARSGPSSATGSVSARVVEAGHGLGWWGEGWRLFKAAPGVWLAMGFVMMLIMVVVQIIPLVGLVASVLLPPMFTGGAMLAAHEQQAGKPVKFERLFAGFSQRTGPLVAVGGLYFAGTALITIVMSVLLVGAVAGAGMDLEGGLEDPAMLMGIFASTTGAIALVVGFAASFALVAALWWAPALVMLRGVEPFAAMKASLRAGLRNWLPMLVYGVLMVVFVILAALPFMLGYLLLVPLVLTSVYASYRDLFEEQE